MNAIEILDWLLDDEQSTPLDQGFIDAYNPAPSPTNPLIRENDSISDDELEGEDNGHLNETIDLVPDELTIDVLNGAQISDALLTFAISHFMGICERHQNDDEHCQRIHQYQTAAGGNNNSKVLFSVPIALKFLYEADGSDAAMRAINAMDNYDAITVVGHYKAAWNAWLATFDHDLEIPTVRPSNINTWNKMRGYFAKNIGGSNPKGSTGHILHRIIYIIAQYMWEDSDNVE